MRFTAREFLEWVREHPRKGALALNELPTVLDEYTKWFDENPDEARWGFATFEEAKEELERFRQQVLSHPQEFLEDIVAKIKTGAKLPGPYDARDG